MNEDVIMLLVNDDATVKELMAMSVPMVTAYRWFSRKDDLINSYERAHKKLAKIRREARAKK